MTTLQKIRAEIEDATPWNTEEKAMKQAVLDIIDEYAEQEPKTVCDLCVYEIPSSSNGKPCTMCPAETKRGAE